VLLGVKPKSLQKCLNPTPLSFNRMHRVDLDEESLEVITCNTQFLHQLDRDGNNFLQRWEKRCLKGKFKAKLLFIPWNAGLNHWTLYVVVNAGMIDLPPEESRDCPGPYILYFDSMTTSGPPRKTVRLIYYMLNTLRHINLSPPSKVAFTEETCPVISPKGKFATFNRLTFCVIHHSPYHTLSLSSPSTKKRLGLWTVRLSLCIWLVSGSPPTELRACRSSDPYRK